MEKVSHLICGKPLWQSTPGAWTRLQPITHFGFTDISLISYS